MHFFPALSAASQMYSALQRSLLKACTILALTGAVPGLCEWKSVMP
jgi:hypothetical protein